MKDPLSLACLSLNSRILGCVLWLLLLLAASYKLRGEGDGMAPNPGNKIRMVVNEGPITGYLIHRVTKYNEFQDACVKLLSSK